MRFSLAFLLAAALTFSAFAQNNYRYTVDLTRVVDDRVQVQLTPPTIKDKEVTFYLPKIVPGTYAIADYGRYVVDFKALDNKGRTLPVEKTEANAWKISKANRLARITYWVDDTWDTKITGPEIFWPAGTNIEENTNFVINTSGFFGYFDGMKSPGFEINIVRPRELYGSTGLIAEQTGASPSSLRLEKAAESNTGVVDVYRTDNYDHLVDSPLMYARPDTAVIRVANTEVLIGSYSPTGKISAKEIAASIEEVLMAQKAFLGGELPVDKYAFIFYFTDQPILSYGALEHSYSSMYYMPEMTIDQLNQQLRDFAAHEFFHILTPLTVHSEEIADFDFNNPRMSQHLWMYEGVTEYFASLVQAQYDLISIDEFIETLREKMLTADQFIDDVPFTEISKFTLEKYHDQYYNVYQKGALIGLCLDLIILHNSKGERNLRDVMLELSQKYGKKKAFKDDKLLDELTEMTYPEVGEFFRRHVKGAGPIAADTASSKGGRIEPLPLEELFDYVGVVYAAEHTFEDLSLGIDNHDLGLTYVDSVPKLQIATTAYLNAMGRALGFQEGDVLIAINGEEIPELGSPAVSPFIQRQMMSLTEGAELSYTVLRKDSTGQQQETILTAPVRMVPITQRHLIAPNPDATPDQLSLREKWLTGS